MDHQPYVNQLWATDTPSYGKGDDTSGRPLTTLFALEAPYPLLEAAAGARCPMRFHTFSLNSSTRNGLTK